MVNRSLSQRLDHHPTLLPTGSVAGMEDVVVGIVHAGAHVGHIAVKCRRRVNVEVQPPNVHTIVGCKDGIKVGRLVVLLPLARQCGTLQCLTSLLPQGVEHLRCMGLDHLKMLVMQVNILP